MKCTNCISNKVYRSNRTVYKLKPQFEGKLEGYYDMWIERCEYMLTQDLPKDWNGIFIATSK